MIATRRPVSRAASPIRLIACACSEGVPCEKFNRATFIPARMSRVSISGDSEAGPIVATILVLCAENAAFMTQTSFCRPRRDRSRLASHARPSLPSRARETNLSHRFAVDFQHAVVNLEHETGDRARERVLHVGIDIHFH